MAPKLTPQDRTKLLEITNEYRSVVARGLLKDIDGTLPPLSNEMYELAYDETLELRARQAVSTCDVDKFDTWIRVEGFVALATSENFAADWLALETMLFFVERMLQKYGYPKNLKFDGDTGDRGLWAKEVYYAARKLGCAANYCDSIRKTFIACAYDKVIRRGDSVYIASESTCTGNGGGCRVHPGSKCNVSTSLCYTA